MQIAIVGLGSILMSDDGVGPYRLKILADSGIQSREQQGGAADA